LDRYSVFLIELRLESQEDIEEGVEKNCEEVARKARKDG
jgi:hypothetical protein